ncbi:MAG TPA: VWA domain-containing protein, partial [Gammaproteobacteria bacterium]|nr:VWA domain-containing protein [Gammaproteobacteria bacterium]
MAERRRFTVFSLSFLDVMSCGFGAVILIFLIINHETEADVQWVKKDLLSEARRLDYEINVGKRDLAAVQQDLEDTLKRVDDERRRRLAMLEDAERKEAEL